MEEQPGSVGPRRGELWHDILLARTALVRVRHRQAIQLDSTSAIELARRDLVDALEAYTFHLDGDGTPVPYRLRDELRLHRGLVRAPWS